MQLLGLIWISFSTVGKVLLVMVVGIVLSKHLASKKESLKGMSYITVYIMLPCLLFTQMTKIVSMESLSRYYAAVLLSVVPMITGFVLSKALGQLVPRQLRGLLTVSCTFQNAISFGLGIAMSLHGVPFFPPDRLPEAQGYVFLYNICCSLALWSFAIHIVRTEAEKDAREAARLQGTVAPSACGGPPATVCLAVGDARGTSRSSTVLMMPEAASTSAVVAPGTPQLKRQESNCGGALLESSGCLPPALLEATKELEIASRDNNGIDARHNTRDDGIEACGLDNRDRRVMECMPENEHGELWSNDDDSADGRLRDSWTTCALTPSGPRGGGHFEETEDPRNVCSSGSPPHEADDDGCQQRHHQPLDLLHQSSDPTQTHLLSFVPKPVEAEVLRLLSGAASAYTTHIRPLLSSTILASFIGIFVALCPPLHAASESILGKILTGGMSMLGDGTVPMTLLILGCNLMADDSANPVAFPRSFVIIVVTVRLFVIPGIFFLLLHLLFVMNAIPENKVFRLTVLVESCAPTAINASVICSLYSYRTREFSRVLFIVYTSSIVSTTAWLMVYLWYLSD
jgi:predicted permease